MASVGQSRHVRSKPMGDMEPEIINRMTKSGRKLQYELRVMQQPERARACGSGAKSSADRRPVDPPPVVELKVFEVNDGGMKTDITFAYNANFFLFATLELARPMAHGRVAAPATPQNPVLTGMPVSGMAYLDRPSEAGYFIFPDLSVRHEGKYRLSFNLYEQTNKPEEDGDQEPGLDVKPSVPMDSKSQEPESSFDWRMELKSKVFDVFSAKKFPGLAESTHLSRVVAEQGCRVRIRRDVRMRRRTDGKPTDEVSDVNEYTRGRAESIDYRAQERARSHSSSSSGSEGERRNSGEFYPPPAAAGHLAFGGQVPQQFAAPPPPMPQQQHHQHPNFSQQPQYAPAPVPIPQGHYAQNVHPQSAYPSFPANRDQMYEHEQWRRQSMAGHGSEQFSKHSPVQEQIFARGPPQLQRYHAHSPPQANILPPINSKMEYESSPTGPLPAARQLASIAPAVRSPTAERRPSHYAEFSEPLIPSATLVPDTPRNGNKRGYQETFRSEAHSQPLRNGQRPPTLDNDLDAEDDDEDTPVPMIYKRANGGRTQRDLPSVA